MVELKSLGLVNHHDSDGVRGGAKLTSACATSPVSVTCASIRSRTDRVSSGSDAAAHVRVGHPSTADRSLDLVECALPPCRIGEAM